MTHTSALERNFNAPTKRYRQLPDMPSSTLRARITFSLLLRSPQLVKRLPKKGPRLEIQNGENRVNKRPTSQPFKWRDAATNSLTDRLPVTKRRLKLKEIKSRRDSSMALVLWLKPLKKQKQTNTSALLITHHCHLRFFFVPVQIEPRAFCPRGLSYLSPAF